MATREDKMAKLLEIEGFDTDHAFLEEFVTDSTCPSICMNDGCDYTEDLEPDQDRGHCPECNTGTLQSGLVLLGVI